MRNKVIAIILIVVLLLSCAGCFSAVEKEQARDGVEAVRLYQVPLSELTESNLNFLIAYCYKEADDMRHLETRQVLLQYVTIYQNEKLLRKG